jgi:hypothetical protein
VAGVASAARRQVPPGFLGVTADGPLLDPNEPTPQIEQEFDQMVRSGVESVRVGVYWSEIQPYPDAASVPAGQAGHFQMIDGIPSDFAALDRLYQEAAARGLRVLPDIAQAPPWARKDPSRAWSPPASAAAFGTFVGTVVRRYGPGGTLLGQPAGHSAPTTTQWQIWNEPAGFRPGDASGDWDDPGVPFEATYIAMLRAARTAIKAADPSGQVVLAGLFGESWVSLQDIYAHGGRGLFDAVAVNMYTRFPADVTKALEFTRRVMNRNGDHRLPLMLTEFSWPSGFAQIPARFRPGYEVTPAQQARRLTQALALLADDRRRLDLTQIYWYTWVSSDTSSNRLFAYAGLRHVNADGSIVAKPAQAAFRRAALHLEGCAKVSTATVCG